MQTIAELNAGALNGAARVKISENLTEFPTEILDLADTLEILDLSGNSLKALPKEFACLKKLKILFLSDNQFEVLPSVLAECSALSMIGFKANEIHTVPDGALPPATRWLILTDNKISALPDSMGSLATLQKLMLAGNKLTELPDSMSQCKALELLRISANRFDALPDFLLHLPKLAWLAFAGNPFCKTFESSSLPTVCFSDLKLGKVLGQGASGVISEAGWVNTPQGIVNQPVALKKYKGEITSDGYPQDELSACIAAGSHANLVKLVAKVEEPQQLGLVMALIETGFSNLGEPPTFESCTRDHFSEEFVLTVTALGKITLGIVHTMLHLYEKGISHGDLYAHNILFNSSGDILFGDFGAASNYASLSESQKRAMQAIEVRAFGCLLEDLLGCCSRAVESHEPFAALVSLKDSCMQANVIKRPSFMEIKERLNAVT